MKRRGKLKALEARGERRLIHRDRLGALEKSVEEWYRRAGQPAYPSDCAATLGLDRRIVVEACAHLVRLNTLREVDAGEVELKAAPEPR